MANEINLRPPAGLSPAATPTAAPANPSGVSSTIPLLGLWHVLCSSSQYWRDKRNISISFALADGSCQSREANGANVDFTKDVVLKSVASYQSISGDGCDNIDTTEGIERAIPNSLPGTMTWQGTGFIKFLTNRWEILGYGCFPDKGGEPRREGDEQIMWMVVYADKSMFTPAALNICTKATRALSAEKMDLIKDALRDFDHEELKECFNSMIDIPQE
ncbi:hypothetical protein FQN49_000064 [Arthroderma sp. PD_2]|nr:hypothetical protein FQN49_000064 [Arthroderma sp. PD_2]